MPSGNRGGCLMGSIDGFALDSFLRYFGILFLTSLSGGAIGVFVGRAQNLGPGINKLQTIGTFGLVAVAAASFAFVGLAVGAAQSQVISGVATGVGFISGAVIFKAGAEIHGLTTAALLWACTSVGLAFGYGQYELAIAAMLYTMMFIWAHEHRYPDLRLLDYLFRSKADKDL